MGSLFNFLKFYFSNYYYFKGM